MERRNLSRTLLALALLALGLASAPAARAQDAASVGWSYVPGAPASVRFTDVLMTNIERAVAVGHDGQTGVVYELRLERGRWLAQQRGAFGAPLHGVAVGPDGTIWAVGDGGLIVRSLPRGQWSIEQPIPGASLRAIQILGDDQQRWAGGFLTTSDGSEEALMLRSDRAGAWARDMAIAGAGRVEGLHFAPGGGWAVGGERIWRYQGGWRSERLPPTCGTSPCPAGLMDVRAVNKDSAWAVGTRHGMCAICVSRPLAIQRGGKGWSTVVPEQPIAGWDPDPNKLSQAWLAGLWLAPDGRGVLVGTWVNRDTSDRGGGPRPIIASNAGGGWALMRAPDAWLDLSAVSMADLGHGLIVGGRGAILAYGYGPQGEPPAASPASRVADPQQPGVRYFPETGHTLRGVFLRYWEANGGLEQFGYPITEEFEEQNPDDGRTYRVQYFERNRFEYHPELAGTRYEVLLGLLGRTISAGRAGDPPFQPTVVSPLVGARYYPETGHNLAPQFLGYWERTGGLAVYGYPISEAFYEVSPTDGQTYLVQYFERNRFEYHPELAGTRYEVLLGLLGSEILRARGWIQ